MAIKSQKLISGLIESILSRKAAYPAKTGVSRMRSRTPYIPIFSGPTKSNDTVRLIIASAMHFGFNCLNTPYVSLNVKNVFLMSRIYRFKQIMNTTFSSSRYDSPTQRVINGFTRAKSAAQEKDTSQKLTN